MLIQNKLKEYDTKNFELKTQICKDKKGRLIFNGKVKIALTEGEPAFNECIEYLKNLEPMEPLEFDPYLTIQPPKSEQEIKDKNDIHKKVDNMIKYEIVLFRLS